MKKTIFSLSIISTLIVLIVFTQSCKKNDSTTFGIYKPIYKTTAEVRSQIKSALPMSLSTVGKIYVKDNYLFINEPDKGIHIFDNSNPSKPINTAFINIPGCEDMAIYGNTLYADCFTDLITIDISNPQQAILKNFRANLFPDRNYVKGKLIDSGFVITDWQKIKDTTIDNNAYVYNGLDNNGLWYDAPMPPFSGILINMSTTSLSNSTSGVGGSMARFTIQNQTLYTVTQSSLNVLGLTNPQQPNFIKSINLGWNIETIYPFQDKLFIGSTTGMYIFDVSNAFNPKAAGFFGHYHMCDPVIADGNYAYVTLHNEGRCNGNINEMDVLDITDIYHPVLLNIIAMTSPRGLAKNGKTLLVCDGTTGLKIFDATNPAAPVLKQKLNMPQTSDVIIYNNVAIVAAVDGLYQLNSINNNFLSMLSKIEL